MVSGGASASASAVSDDALSLTGSEMLPSESARRIVRLLPL